MFRVCLLVASAAVAEAFPELLGSDHEQVSLLQLAAGKRATADNKGVPAPAAGPAPACNAQKKKYKKARKARKAKHQELRDARVAFQESIAAELEEKDALEAACPPTDLPCIPADTHKANVASKVGGGVNPNDLREMGFQWTGCNEASGSWHALWCPGDEEMLLTVPIAASSGESRCTASFGNSYCEARSGESWVWLMHNGEVIAKAGSHGRETATFTFKAGDKLELKETKGAIQLKEDWLHCEC